MATKVQVRMDPAAIASLVREPGARELTGQAGDEFADYARDLAPHLTGAGAASISGEVMRSREGGQFAPGYESHVSWDDEHHYMWFREAGTIYQAADPFMELALDGYAI